jgi:bifunctional DNase/RNase
VAEHLLALAAASRRPLRGGPRALLLKETDGPRAVPIVVGVPEAEAVAMQLQGHTPPRPLSYDLMRRLLEAGGLRVQQAAVTRLEGDTYFATVALQTPDGQAVGLDARPSDAVNLALRSGAPLYVAAGLLVGPEAWQRFLERFGTRFEGVEPRPSALPPA